ncbi:hypothetical protein B9Z51_15550 [Limnohabitans sp. T6-5]|uniref:hypothetical protein n=1 Tax=Limnohabitans sp. T6-5 TaxID=1100724 RepID=UPI000DD21EEB|nr:hypothetical protein [Limnohabitans sp. T6-5]PUE06237.1 hypothetical protein B9Z51_15550 [Limnohabitans sp. T6-5]
MSHTEPLQTIKSMLSDARLATFEAAIHSPGPILPRALALYAWNAQISAALLAPLHVCEVVIRNAVSDALAAVYGSQWPWESVFENSLPSPKVGFNPRHELVRARAREQSTGKVIAELKMVFWQKMFTGRFDTRLWNDHLFSVLPHLDATKSVQELRRLIHGDLEQLRALRNRIAHHEPIFKRPLKDDFVKMQELIAFRCPTTSLWMANNQQATSLMTAKPV